mmetsp:Transcript_29083/g.60959  ORF Transcript_29083/g.60959 Transcript_29083/m.60959 type:complete len:223 (+) Transcript_29083:536-1204(+)
MVRPAIGLPNSDAISDAAASRPAPSAAPLSRLPLGLSAFQPPSLPPPSRPPRSFEAEDLLPVGSRSAPRPARRATAAAGRGICPAPAAWSLPAPVKNSGWVSTDHRSPSPSVAPGPLAPAAASTPAAGRAPPPSPVQPPSAGLDPSASLPSEGSRPLESLPPRARHPRCVGVPAGAKPMTTSSHDDQYERSSRLLEAKLSISARAMRWHARLRRSMPEQLPR